MSALESAIRGGQPSTTTPIPPPCDSPKVVTRKSWPKLLPIKKKTSTRAKVEGSPGGYLKNFCTGSSVAPVYDRRNSTHTGGHRPPLQALGMTGRSDRFESELEIVNQIPHAFHPDA